MLGSVGQSNYSAAKGGIATLTLVQAAELGRYGITANAICPIARTRMTEGAFGDVMKAPEHGFDINDPANVSPFVAWLGSKQSKSVTGRVWEVFGGTITVFDNRQPGEIARVVQYEIDTAAVPPTARMIWEYEHVDGIFSGFMGSARRQADGNTVIGGSL